MDVWAHSYGGGAAANKSGPIGAISCVRIRLTKLHHTQYRPHRMDKVTPVETLALHSSNSCRPQHIAHRLSNKTLNRAEQNVHTEKNHA